MQQEASIAIVMRARDEAAAAFQRVQRGLGQTSQRIEGTRVSTQAGTSAFSMMKGMLLPLAGGLITAAGAFQALKTNIMETSDATAAAEFQARLMGAAYYENLQRIRPELIAVGYQYGLTEAESLKMYTAMQQGSHRTNISLEEVTDAMRIANRMQKDSTETAYAYGRALDGSIAELRQLTKVQWATKESAIEVSKSMKDQRDIFDRLRESIKLTVDVVRREGISPSALAERWQRGFQRGQWGGLTGALFSREPTVPTPITGLEPPSIITRPTPVGGTIVNLNIGGDLVVDTEERQARLQREIRDGIDQINRGTK